MDTTTESNGTGKKCGRRYGQDQREAILAGYRESGMELSAFALQADVSNTTLKRWMGAGGKGPRLVAVRMKEAEGRTAVVEARFVCGATIRAPAILLPELVRSLRRPC
jgi:transposase-like protein